MKKSVIDFSKEERAMLASYAVSSEDCGGREFPEPEHPYRLPFQRDKDRIVHSQAFKRLEYKTQVFVYSEGDHFRNRLTHTLEVAGVSRTVAKTLGLHEDLAEAIALAHDLGHAPFGHAGQDRLSELMKGFGGFEHNKQSLRIVRKLERRYPEFEGLNLTRATLVGIMKHGGDYEKDNFLSERQEMGPSLESGITDRSDEIAYTVHDIEDGLERKFLREDEIEESPLWKRFAGDFDSQYKDIDTSLRRRSICRMILNGLVSDLIETTESNLAKNKVSVRKDCTDLWKKRVPIVSFSESMDKNLRLTKKILFEKLYQHPQVLDMSKNGQEIIERLFFIFIKNPKEVPLSYQSRLALEGTERVVCDYIAGMTDRYAAEKLKNLS